MFNRSTNRSRFLRCIVIHFSTIEPNTDSFNKLNTKITDRAQSDLWWVQFIITVTMILWSSLSSSQVFSLKWTQKSQIECKATYDEYNLLSQKREYCEARWVDHCNCTMLCSQFQTYKWRQVASSTTANPDCLVCPDYWLIIVLMWQVLIEVDS